MEAAVSEVAFRQLALKLQKTREIPLTVGPVRAVEVQANRHTLNDTERAGVQRHLIVQGDLSACGLVNAVTHDSQEVVEVQYQAGIDPRCVPRGARCPPGT